MRTQRIQRLGRLLSGMVMPNIGAYIAWGLLTALFIPTGWAPNESLARLVDPMIIYLLPLLIGYTGGKIIYGQRGGVLGAVVTMGAIVGTSAPMIFGAMVAGPFAGWLIKKFDEFVEKRIPTGFEMLVNNFSGGILGGLLAVFAFLGIGPVVEFLSDQSGSLVEGVIDAGVLPITSLVIEPAKILFLNNVINHGVLSPLAITQAAETGKSILFLLETNPGPGLGILLVYFVFAKGTAKQSAPGAILVHFFGGIHEIYFPYVLMQPKLLPAVIAGGVAGVLTFSMLGAGVLVQREFTPLLGRQLTGQCLCLSAFSQHTCWTMTTSRVSGHNESISTPTGVVAAKIGRGAGVTPRVSAQRPVGASDPNYNTHQVECGRRSYLRSALAELHTAHGAAIVPAARIADAHLPTIADDRSREACCHADPSVAGLQNTSRQTA